MEVMVTVPDDIVERLEARWTDLPRHALENLAIRADREGLLTAGEVQRTLALPSRWETEELLKQAGADLHYSEADLEEDLATLNKLAGQ